MSSNTCITHPEENMETFFCSSFEQEEVYYSDIPELLDYDLLEENPRLYKFLLEQYSLYRNPKDVANSSHTDEPDPMYIAMTKLSGDCDDSSYDVTPQICLAILAGDKSDYAKMRAKNSPELNVYYGHSSENLDDDLACDILEWMVKYGADPNKPNSIGVTPLDVLKNHNENISGRVNNERFKQMIISYNNSNN